MPQAKQHEVWFIWGSENIELYNNSKTAYIKAGTPGLTYHSYPTAELLNAFLDGVNAADGWLDSEQLDEDPEKEKDVQQ